MLAEQIANWTIENLRDVRGYFIISAADFTKSGFPTCAGQRVDDLRAGASARSGTEPRA